MSDPLLSNLRVLDLSDTIAGQFASRLMADYGAHVTLVEDRAGSPMRRRAPFWDAAENDSIIFWHLNSGKHSIVLDKSDPSYWEELVKLCRIVDAIIVSDRNLAARLDLECESAVIGLVTDFGAQGPYANWLGSELIHQALSGSMYVSGLPDREPLFGIGERASYSAGLWLYISMLAALYGRREHSEKYGVCEVTLHEAAAAMEENFSLRWAYSKHLMKRGGDSSRAVCSLQCKDGWAILFVRSISGQWSALCNVLHAPDLATHRRFQDWSGITRNWDEASRELNFRSREWCVDDLVRACAPVGLVIAKVENADTLRQDHHLRERRFWQDVDTVDGGRPALGALFRVPSAPAERNRPSPKPGASYGRAINPRPASPPPLKRVENARPLRDLSVLDVTTAWAGPMATRILALLGARVIKVEGPQWLDSWRGPLAPARTEQYPDNEPGERPYNRCVRFNAQNLGKEDIVLDLKSAEGRQSLRGIASTADAIVANLRPGALRRVGVDFDTLSQINPGICVVEMSVVGEGPDESRIGLGPTMEAMAGIADLIGYEDSGPLGSGSSYMDPMGALHGAAAALTLLFARLHSGRGGFAEVAQREAAMTWIGEILLDRKPTRHRAGNSVPNACPHDAFPTRGDDEWIAIAVYDDDQWASLCATLDLKDAVADQRFETMQVRRENRHSLYSLISEKTCSAEKFALSQKLQSARVPAAPVLNGRDLFDDSQLRASGWFSSLLHPEAGRHDYAGLPIIFGGRRSLPASPSPCFGAQTSVILRDCEGLSNNHVVQDAGSRADSIVTKD
jgi:crotonobetainyl-CoA:carnitine CoA-transferase CaiB-like acyl-CoA transferase